MTVSNNSFSFIMSFNEYYLLDLGDAAHTMAVIRSILVALFINGRVAKWQRNAKNLWVSSV
jgi:hypothetical protein